jgi:hypothetical protein
VQFIQRAEISPEKPEGAIQHVALFKNVLVAADGRAFTLSHSSSMYSFSFPHQMPLDMSQLRLCPWNHSSYLTLIPRRCSSCAEKGTTSGVTPRWKGNLCKAPQKWKLA